MSQMAIKNGVPVLPNFLRELFNDRERFYKQDSVDQDFFNGILELPLFYEALRSERTGDDVYINFNCRIPFLNGGLFDPLNGYDLGQNYRYPLAR